MRKPKRKKQQPKPQEIKLEVPIKFEVSKPTLTEIPNQDKKE